MKYKKFKLNLLFLSCITCFSCFSNENNNINYNLKSQVDNEIKRIAENAGERNIYLKKLYDANKKMAQYDRDSYAFRKDIIAMDKKIKESEKLILDGQEKIISTFEKYFIKYKKKEKLPTYKYLKSIAYDKGTCNKDGISLFRNKYEDKFRFHYTYKNNSCLTIRLYYSEQTIEDLKRIYNLTFLLKNYLKIAADENIKTGKWKSNDPYYKEISFNVKKNMAKKRNRNEISLFEDKRGKKIFIIKDINQAKHNILKYKELERQTYVDLEADRDSIRKRILKKV